MIGVGGGDLKAQDVDLGPDAILELRLRHAELIRQLVVAGQGNVLLGASLEQREEPGLDLGSELGLGSAQVRLGSVRGLVRGGEILSDVHEAKQRLGPG